MERHLRTRIIYLTSRNARETAKNLREKVALEPSVRRAAEKIILDVRKHGDSALRTCPSDSTEPVCSDSQHRNARLRIASAKIPSDQARALRFVAEQLRSQRN